MYLRTSIQSMSQFVCSFVRVCLCASSERKHAATVWKMSSLCAQYWPLPCGEQQGEQSFQIPAPRTASAWPRGWEGTPSAEKKAEEPFLSTLESNRILSHKRKVTDSYRCSLATWYTWSTSVLKWKWTSDLINACSIDLTMIAFLGPKTHIRSSLVFVVNLNTKGAACLSIDWLGKIVWPVAVGRGKEGIVIVRKKAIDGLGRKCAALFHHPRPENSPGHTLLGRL